MYTVPATANVRRRSTIRQHRASRARVKLLGRRFHHVDIITALVFLVTILLNSHYLALIDLTTITESSLDPSRPSLDWTLLVAMAALSSSFSSQSKSNTNKNNSNNNPITTTTTMMLKTTTTNNMTTTESSPFPSPFNQTFLIQQIFSTPISFDASSSPLSSSSFSLTQHPLLKHVNTRDTSDDLTACFPHSNTTYYTFLINYWFYIDMCIYWFIPFIVMSVCSVIILGKVIDVIYIYINTCFSEKNNIPF